MLVLHSYRHKRKVLSLIDSLRTNPAESVRIGRTLIVFANLVRVFPNPNIKVKKRYKFPHFFRILELKRKL